MKKSGGKLIPNQRQPRILSLRNILDEYLTFQEEVITRRTQFDLRKAKDGGDVEAIKAQMEKTNQISMEVFGKIYQQQGGQQTSQKGGQGTAAGEEQGEEIGQLRKTKGPERGPQCGQQTGREREWRAAGVIPFQARRKHLWQNAIITKCWA